MLTPDVLTNLGLDLASVGVSDQQNISSTGCTIDSQDQHLVGAMRSVSALTRTENYRMQTLRWPHLSAAVLLLI